MSTCGLWLISFGHCSIKVGDFVEDSMLIRSTRRVKNENFKSLKSLKVDKRPKNPLLRRPGSASYIYLHNMYLSCPIFTAQFGGKVDRHVKSSKGIKKKRPPHSALNSDILLS